MNELVFVALGTRGDILSLLFVAENILCQSLNEIAINFVTHSTYSSSEFIRRSHLSSMSYVKFWFVDNTALEVDNRKSGEFYDLKSLMHVFKMLRNCQISAVIANLFALSAWLFAESISVKCIFIHPCIPVVNKSKISEILLSIKIMSPKLYQQLFFKTSTTEVNKFIWCQLLSPIFSSYYDEMRDCLGLLSPLSIQYCHLTEITQPLLLVCTSPLISTTDDFINLRNVVVSCGYIFQPKDHSIIFSNYNDDIQLSIFIENNKDMSKKIICIDFGSMSQIIEEKYSLHLFVNVVKSLSDFFSFIIIWSSDILTNILPLVLILI
jgi:hypothetical protein